MKKNRAMLDAVPNPPSHQKETSRASDKLNEALQQADTVLRGMSFGVGASVTIECREPAGDDPFGYVLLLSFAKHDPSGRWGLHLVSGPQNSGEPEDYSVKDLFKAPLETRHRAAKLVPRLVQELMRQHKKHLGNWNDSADALTAFLKDLPSAPNPEEYVDAMVETFEGID